MRLRHILLTVFLLGLALPAFSQFYNGSQLTFGKNRVQHREFLWQYMKFDQYSIYFYEGGRNLADYTARVTPQIIEEMEDKLDFVIQQDIIIVVYKTQSEFRQSNVGLQVDEDQNIGGRTMLQSNKLFLYYEGDYDKFLTNLRRGIAEIAVTQLMLGSNWRESLRNSTLVNVPEWYMEGIVSYLCDEWTPETESIVRDGILSNRFRKFNRLTGLEARFAGQFMWRYIAEVYGPSVIPNILYMARMSRSVDSGFQFVLGTSLKSLSQEFITYFQEKYRVQGAGKHEPPWESLPIKTKKKHWASQFKVSQDERYAVYTTNVLGQYRVFLYDIEKGKRKRIHKAEHKLERIADRSYPVIAWHPSSQAFSYVVERRGQLIMYNYDLDKGKKTRRELFGLEKVIDMQYAKDGRRMVFSGVRNGQSDIYLYYAVGNRQEQLTNDVYDDLNPRFVNDDKGIIFSSNRPDDTLRTRVPFEYFPVEKDIYIYDLETKSKILTRITNTPKVNEIMPAQLDSSRYTFLASKGNRLYQRMTAVRDSAIAAIDTTIHYRYFSRIEPLPAHPHNTIEYEVNARTGKYTQLMYRDGRYQFLIGDRDRELEAIEEMLSKRPDAKKKEREETVIDPSAIPPVNTVTSPVPPVERKLDIYNYQFITDDEDEIIFEKKVVDVTETKKDDKAAKPRDGKRKAVDLPTPRNYNLNFSIQEVTTQLNQTNITEFYQPLTGPDNIFPGFSPLLQVATTDLFEDYRVVGGFRTSFNLRNTDIMLSFQNYKKRLDKEIFFFRNSNRLLGTFTAVDIETYFVGTRLSYPINDVLRLEGTVMYRNDRFSALSTDLFQLENPSFYEHQLGIKPAVVFDNTLPMGLNLRRGWRFKIWGEYYQNIAEFQNSFLNFSESFSLPENGDFLLLGGDFRFYQPIHRNIIWANRLAGSTSIGSRRVVYYLGGVDNWLFRRVDNSLEVPTGQGFAFQSLAAPMRGFWVNARNGNSFAVLNSEIRFPVFSYFSGSPLKSDFLETFQLVGFGDVGSAWTGPHPYSEDNVFNQQDITTGGGNITVIIKNNREPIIWSYGMGVRARLLGYFVRLDYAWGVDDGVVQPGVFHFSINLDF